MRRPAILSFIDEQSRDMNPPVPERMTATNPVAADRARLTGMWLRLRDSTHKLLYRK